MYSLLLKQIKSGIPYGILVRNLGSGLLNVVRSVYGFQEQS